MDGLSQRRVRHISSIQIRNLTANPVRDAFASALSQPAEQPQFNAPGYFSDDLDVTISRKRGRRISANSIATFKSVKSEDSDEHASVDSRGRRQSRVSFHGSVGAASGSSARFQVGSAPSIRGHRPRTSSMTSSLNQQSTMASTVLPFSANIPDHSQAGLEKVIKARLFETFLAVSVEPTPPPTPIIAPLSPTLSQPPRSPKLNGSISRKGAKPSPLSPTDKAFRRDSMSSPSLASPSKHTPKSPSISSRPNGKAVPPISPRKSATPTTTPTISTARPRSPSPSSPSLPDYLSPIHRASTNPSFPVDTRSWRHAGHTADPGGRKLRLELWGKIRQDAVPVHGKGKEKERASSPDEETDWRVLEEWNVDLEQLLPLSDYQDLPSNTLVITLNPPGRPFYLPSSLNLERRSPTPSVDAGYASDPEAGGRAAKKAAEAAAAKVSPDQLAADVAAVGRRRQRRDVNKGRPKTANWQDLFKLVTLQTCIQDTEVSLNEIVREIDTVLEGDPIWALKREVSERESAVQVLRKNCAGVYDQSELLKEQIELRRQQIQERREMLALAQELREEDEAAMPQRQDEVSEARDALVSLRSRFTPTRTTLISTLATIFPIDLLSPPDLLYTIVEVPLPIPLAASDPAPPLSLASRTDVTEDGVATALGYVAQVVQLLAAYLGKGLVYPITCIGSRSMIRDGISAMVGPRMFPLFSKGVDTYRFEYGVFLLNKDIELLMADRDLRALDMRHTLPNLKNLLLTLTDGEGAELGGPRSFDSPELSVTGLESPRAASPVEDANTNGNGAVTPKAEAPTATEGSSANATTPPASGATTPTPTTTEAPKKGGSRFMLSPIAGFLRARYPSAIRAATMKPVSSTEDGEAQVQVEDGAASGGDDEDDRRTIRGDVGSSEEAAARVEKFGDVTVGAAPPTTPTVVK
ncbi:hypothetical protein MKEN_00767300 [Mycena kentingensis (nom. inval.)]|nr:hypothetical protein MKEN_00767300 [Mycena kentingensis (nom. inval.)]